MVALILAALTLHETALLDIAAHAANGAEVAGAHTWDYWDRRIREFLPILMDKLKN